MIETFQVSARKHEQDAKNGNAAWKVFIHVRFRSDDPAQWGELRAFGGAWRRSIDRSVRPADRREDTSQLVEPLTHDLDIEDAHLALLSRKLPEWGHVQGPLRGLNEHLLRLGNDQHIEIFYSKVVPGVRRSDPNAKVPKEHKLWEYDPVLDSMESDDINQVERPVEVDLDRWHIVGRDEPCWGPVGETKYIEYWHQAEFQIRKPGSLDVIARKRLFLRVQGKPPFMYLEPIVE